MPYTEQCLRAISCRFTIKTIIKISAQKHIVCCTNNAKEEKRNFCTNTKLTAFGRISQVLHLQSLAENRF